MIREDYLLRQIEQFVEAVIRAKEDDDVQALIDAVAQGLRHLTGLSADTLSRLAPDAIVPLISTPDGLEKGRAKAIAALLLEDADLQSDPGIAHGRRAAAVGILAMVSGDDADALEHLDGVVRSVHLSALHPSTLARLAERFEAAGRFDRAEDTIFAWLSVDADAAFEAGMALYERLWALPDARLRAGGLSTDEVLESMAELQKRAGRK